jgi:hypothetical protein
VNRKTILLAFLVAACVPCAAALAAVPERFRADAVDVSVNVTGSYSGDSTGGPPDDYTEHHQRAQFSYGGGPNVWFPVRARHGGRLEYTQGGRDVYSHLGRCGG